ncbi:MAG: pyrroline-5-carboxylate reductase [Alkalibacterium sp.]|nr:pyrroline-5-carboxylate reductase [Alkalibacterium sp.]
MTIGFIGFGNMAQAIAKGLLEKQLVTHDELLFSNQSEDKRQQLMNTFNIKGTSSNQDVWDQSDIVIVAVKPYQMDEVLTGLDKTAHPFVISVAAGVTNAQLASHLKASAFLRTMPNLNSQVGEGMTAIVDNLDVEQSDLDKTKEIFKAVGEVVELPESQLGAFIALAGSSPALVFMFIDTLARAGVKYGLTKEKATKIAAQAVLGSGKTVLETAHEPWTLIDQVSSPGGVTVEGILSLLKDDFASSIIHSVDAMVEKNESMSKG